ncbi:DUF4832 domain-containing protein [Actinoplanes awajinensis]|uniref:DUF4832 domain-containing protein n=1 Tax=Actinoplanes awajinensis subsp. mycoplanecinus TaxID=135947 RepID=A0A124G8S5_9ACTN|nr:DUF4832 domain-containing protein [Actinoplanes awajinensis]KUL26801.1 hypothetical protein ADL15_37070 [Actinoplanes awajinensis subsp. mycoplanecinus]
MRILPVVAAATVLLLPGVACAAPPATTSNTRTYDASDADFANPGRGFFSWSETHLYADGTGWAPLDADALAAARESEAHSVVYRIVYLERYRDSDTLAAADLNLIKADFAAARQAGVKLVLRFAYTADDDADAPVARVVKHIRQLAPLLTQNADLITALQAGFVGRWGEWYYTQNFAAWPDRRKVINALLAATTAPIQVRTPEIKKRLVPAAYAARVGIHDDCFLAGTDDYGTFPADTDFAWMAAQSPSMLVGGETCEPSDRSGWASASSELAAYHWTYLNPSFNTDVLTSWGADGLAEASRRLGYRLSLVSAAAPSTVKVNGAVTVRLTLTNQGYAAPAQKRPVRLVLSGPITQSVMIPADVRTWAPGKTVSLTVSFTAPSKAGAYDLALSLPDPSTRLAATPAYAIRLANPDTWNPDTGTNPLGLTVTVK